MATASGQRNAITDPDVALMLRVRDGDMNAFAELMQKHQDRVLALFYNLVGNYEEAEDLTQETFLRIYRYRKSYKPTAKFSTWLFRIVHNLASNARRTKRRKPASQFPLAHANASGQAEELWAADDTRSVGTKVADLELCQLVRGALERLNERQRLALLLHKFEGLPYSEIAEIMDTTVPAIKSLLARARYELREILGPYVLGKSAVGGPRQAAPSAAREGEGTPPTGSSDDRLER